MRDLTNLKKTIANMELGDVIVITLLYKNNYSDEMDEMYTELAKIRWMDSYTYLLGGTMDDVLAIKASDPDDLEEEGLLVEAQNVIDKIIDDREPDDIDFTNDGDTVEIHSYGGCIRPCEVDNMVYHNHK